MAETGMLHLQCTRFQYVRPVLISILPDWTASTQTGVQAIFKVRGLDPRNTWQLYIYSKEWSNYEIYTYYKRSEIMQ